MAKIYPLVQVKKRPFVNRQRWTEEDCATALAMARKGVPYAQIAVKLKRPTKGVQSKIYALQYALHQQLREKPKVQVDAKSATKSNGIHVLVDAEAALKDRIDRIGPCVYLDDKPCTAQRLMVEYNKIQIAKGADPVCRATECLI